MQGNWNNGRPHYRCRSPAEYARAKALAHPATVYVREDHILPALDRWLSTAFAPEHVTSPLAALDQAHPEADTRSETLRRQITDADRKLDRHRATLEAGADPAMITEWTRRVQAERQAAYAQLDALGSLSSGTASHPRLTAKQIKALVDRLGGLLTILRTADPDDRAGVYKQLAGVSDDHGFRVGALMVV
jgi:site-specific DNA recombinase